MNHRKSTIGRLELLENIATGRYKSSEFIFKACHSQTRFANLTIAEFDIFPLSLNTLKSFANEVIPNGGWAKLDALRRDVIQHEISSHIKTSKKKKIIKSDLKIKIQSLEKALCDERRYRIRLQVAYEELLNRLRQIGNDDQETVNYLNRQAKGFSFKRISLSSSERDEK